MTDDQGYQDLGCYGAPDIATPHLDQLARDNLRLTSFYSAQAVCSASRAGLLTGCYPNRIGIHGALMPNSPKGLASSEVTIAEMLKPLGYATAIFGKWHLGDHPDFSPLNNGFDQFFGILYSNDMWPYHPLQDSIFDFGPLELFENRSILDTLRDQSDLTVQITERSVGFIEDHSDQPFFLYVPHPQPHVPLYVSDRFAGHSERGLYGDVIMEIDWSVSQIISALKKAKVYDQTLLIFTSDNGPWLAYGDHAGTALPFREGKGTAWEGGQRVPCIVKLPGVTHSQIINTPVMNIDVLPTVAALTGARLPEQQIDGANVLDILRSKTHEPAQTAYYFYYRTNELHAVRHGDWKLYFPHSYRSLNGRQGGSEGLPVAYEYLQVAEIELYDLANDPAETRNLASDRPDLVDKLSALGEIARERTGDSLQDRDGAVNRPPGSAQWTEDY